MSLKGFHMVSKFVLGSGLNRSIKIFATILYTSAKLSPERVTIFVVIIG